MSSNAAIIDPSAKIGEGVEIGPWSIIGPNVEIGDNSKIGSHVIIRSDTKIGKNNQLYQFSSIGEDPSDKKYHGEKAFLEIGDDNIIREGVTIHRGTEFGGGITKIGNDNLFMPYTHVAHDCLVGNHTVFSNNAAISGHVEVGDWAILGGYAGIYQFVKIGAHSFIGAQTHVNMDVPAFVLVNGMPPCAKGINITGLNRRKYSKSTINALRSSYKMLYRQGNTTDEALIEMALLTDEFPEVQILIDSVKASSKGIIR